MASDPRTSTKSVAEYWQTIEAMIPPDASHYSRWMRLAFFAGFNACFDANCKMAYEDLDIVNRKLEAWQAELESFLSELQSATKPREDAPIRQADIDAGKLVLRHVPRGQWQIMRANGIVEMRTGKPTNSDIKAAIGATGIDSVTLRHNGRPIGVVMLVDDTGLVDGKKVNKAASELYWAQCVPGTTNPICGDVVLVNDSDFR